ncbi:hypothetical protein HPP92_015520 [Vanilla planifolia]|uniref:Uncharacterized protein n=1 Tax=Vanilla planifolia TaxID=51239 RepID=A0A835UTS6_VANPL|nr:hypothetical protein HPP92_015520 [Vanilla planifolia]
MAYEDMYLRTRGKVDCLVFDLDDTFIPRELRYSSGGSEEHSYKVHAYKVLSRLGLEDCEGIICFETLNEGSGGLFAAPILCVKSSEFVSGSTRPTGQHRASKSCLGRQACVNIQAGKSIGA